jgi:hypothetical protein
MKHHRLLEFELEFEQAIYQDKPLSVFRRNPSTWELLLYLAQLENGSEDGIYNTLDRLQTRYLGNSAMLKFIRERRDDGTLLFTEHTKRSKWKISLSPELREALFSTLEFRNAQLMRGLSAPTEAPEQIQQGSGSPARSVDVSA